ncbi:5-formyltetrahydrofolate cyclo-ligase [Veronia pacifica]|uniref:5-formyltetrahydrofolate cyclo-ligase n=1 Tax=Veronia pacifica TaxID=1080227 RepID=A0A1C3EDM0_9GAMM|nr:5-formyltetrahydrofolate cyclo-ligase [Veronia pacifica]ODA31342.1 5-formyltetrahydrofolate cyclo-ligase [Veronia pacifica]
MSPSPEKHQQRQTIRKHIRQARRALTVDEQQHAANCLLAKFIVAPEIEAANKVALYLSVDGEINTQPLIEACWKQGKEVCLPVLHPFSSGHLLFLKYTPDTAMAVNGYGIPEPVLDVRRVCPIDTIDVICTPLVAFDDAGQRLGMGGGYYDRTLAATPLNTLAIGLAHDCQQVEKLPVEAWDIPLPHILTPSRHWQW